MDKKEYPMWEASEDVPSMMALMAFIGLWGFFTTAATLTLGH